MLNDSKKLYEKTIYDDFCIIVFKYSVYLKTQKCKYLENRILTNSDNKNVLFLFSPTTATYGIKSWRHSKCYWKTRFSWICDRCQNATCSTSTSSTLPRTTTAISGSNSGMLFVLNIAHFLIYLSMAL